LHVLIAATAASLFFIFTALPVTFPGIGAGSSPAPARSNLPASDNILFYTAGQYFLWLFISLFRKQSFNLRQEQPQPLGLRVLVAPLRAGQYSAKPRAVGMPHVLPDKYLVRAAVN
jgi:hypothetical protein